MNRVHLVILWHMHQPQYRDPSNGRYVLPWTRLHALKDYWGMVKMLEEFPNVHATFNLVPSLAAQLEEYASGRFDEPWFQIAFAPADSLTIEDKREVLVRAFQLNHDNLLSRWQRFRELFDWVRSAGVDAAATQIGLRDLRDLQLLSQLAWMDEEYLANDPVVSELARKGSDFTERDKDQLRAKQIELLGLVIPEYRRGSERGQIEISTTPYYHPILPLLCDTDIARVANSWTPLPNPPFRYPQDAREQLVRARALHEKMIGQPPVGLWPSEGSVSDQALGIAAELGFKWFATDEGVLGRTLNIGFWRDAAGFPESGAQLYSPWRIRRDGKDIVGLFRDHYLSDLVGFVYSRMDPSGAAYDLHHRIRAAGERIHGPRPVTVCLILDGENAWEYYPGNGREFLRQFYRNVQNDPDIRALTATEAIAAAGEIPVLEGIFPASWINANFDVWIGHNEDVQAWNLLRDAREEYEKEAQRRAANEPNAVSEKQLAKAFESVLAAEGSDWCWWYGPENSSANDAEFDALYRKHLTEIYLALGREAPESLAQPIKTGAEAARLILPSAYLDINVDGRETSFFEWLGAGIYTSDQRQGAMHGRVYFMETLFYGFAEDRFFVRVDLFPEGRIVLRDCEFRITIHAAEEIRVSVRVLEGRVIGFVVEHNDVCRLNPHDKVTIALDKILEVSIKRDVVPVKGKSFRLGVALWQGGLPIDLLPGEGSFEVQLGEDLFAWQAS